MTGLHNGAVLFHEFDLALRDHMTDCLGDTLDDWVGGIVADIEYITPPEQYDAPRVL